MAKYCRIVTIVDLIRALDGRAAQRLINDAWTYLNKGKKDEPEYKWETFEVRYGSGEPISKCTAHTIAKPSLGDIKAHNGADVRVAYDIGGYVIGVWLCLWENDKFIKVSLGELDGEGNEVHPVFEEDGKLTAWYTSDLQLSPGINEVAQQI